MQLEALRKDMVAAMKAKDKERKESISSLVSAVKKAAIDAGCRDDIPESMVDQVILKELKTAKEQIDTCPDSRQDLKAEYQFRYDVIKEYERKSRRKSHQPGGCRTLQIKIDGKKQSKKSSSLSGGKKMRRL